MVTCIYSLFRPSGSRQVYMPPYSEVLVSYLTNDLFKFNVIFFEMVGELLFSKYKVILCEGWLLVRLKMF